MTVYVSLTPWVVADSPSRGRVSCAYGVPIPSDALNLSYLIATGQVGTSTLPVSPSPTPVTYDGANLLANGQVVAGGGGAAIDDTTPSASTVFSSVKQNTTYASIDADTVLALRNEPMTIVGHSFGAPDGTGADVGGHALEIVASRVGTQAATNLAVGGTRSDQILAVVQGLAQNTRGVLGIAGGHRNDQNFYSNSLSRAATLAEVFRSIFAYGTCRQVMAATSQAFQYGPGWDGTGTSTAAGAYVDISFTNDAAFVAFAAITAAGTTFTVKNAAGTTLKTGTSGGYGVAFTAVAKVGGQGAGAHTVRLTAAAAGLTLVGLIVPAVTPRLIVWELEPPYNPAVVSGGATANTVSVAYQAATQAAVAADFDMSRVVIVDYPPTWDPTVDTCPDGVHPNGSGQRKIAARAIARVRSAGIGVMQGLNYILGPLADNTTYTTATPAYLRTSPAATAPSAPVASAAAGNQIAASWTIPDDGGATISSYDYRVSPAGAATWTTVTGLAATQQAVSINGLTQGSSYDVQVRAVNPVGASAWSASATATAGATGTSFTDNFNRSDATTTGNGWTAGVSTATTNFAIASNVVGLVTSTVATYTQLSPSDCITANQFAQMDVTTVTANVGTVNPRVAVRYAVNGASFDAYYGCYNPSASRFEIYKAIAGAATLVGSSTGTTTQPAVPYTIRIEATGSTQRLLFNGSPVATGTDTALTAGRKTGMQMRYATGGDTSQRVDNWSNGDL